MKPGNIVGNNIRRVRLNLGLTQEQLALGTGLSQGYINHLESGRRRYTQKSLELIADALSIPIIDLFKEEEKHAAAVTKGTGKKQRKSPDKKEFLALLKKLPDHVVQHYLTLLKLENDIWKRKI